MEGGPEGGGGGEGGEPVYTEVLEEVEEALDCALVRGGEKLIGTGVSSETDTFVALEVGIPEDTGVNVSGTEGVVSNALSSDVFGAILCWNTVPDLVRVATKSCVFEAIRTEVGEKRCISASVTFGGNAGI